MNTCGTVFEMSVRMKKIITFAFLLFAVVAKSSDGQKVLRSVKNEAFKEGEILTFRIHYGIMSAGTATLEVKKDLMKIGSRECYHVVGTGETVGAFDWFFKVRDRYESVIDKNALIPWLFIRRVDEGGYHINQNIIFNHYTDSVKSEKKTISVPEYTQDLVSAFYYARNIDFTNAKEGDLFPLNGYIDDEIFPMNLKFIGRETISSKKGKFKCIKFRPQLQEGRVFKDNEDMTVWVSDDKNKIPVRVQTEILIGSIKMDLVDFQNLNSEPALEKD